MDQYGLAGGEIANVSRSRRRDRGTTPGSLAALAAALFQHAYIWVHYYCTEAPDMDLIYSA